MSLASDFSLIRRILGQTRSFLPHVGIIFLVDILGTGISLLTPVPIQIAVDSVIGSEPLPRPLLYLLPASWTTSPYILVVVTAGLLIAIVLASQLQTLGSQFLRTRTSEKITLEVRSRLFRHMQHLSMASHEGRGSPDALYRIQHDASSIQWVILGNILPFLSALLGLVAMAVILINLSPLLALIALGISPALIILSLLHRRRMPERYQVLTTLEAGSFAILQEVLTSLRIVKAFGRQEHEEGRFATVSDHCVRSRVNVTCMEGIFGVLGNLTTAIGTATIVIVGFQSVIAETLTLGELLLILAYLGQIYGPLVAVTTQTANMQGLLVSARRVFEILDEAPESQPKYSRHSGNYRCRGDIVFERVDFSYNAREVLRQISFHLPAGQRLGIAGRTGVGKTTLAGLLLRFHDPQQGRILLDGQDIQDIELNVLRNQISVVLQDSLLFSTTVAENIAYGRPDATLQMIEEAAKAAAAHDFILQLPNGYDTPLGEHGCRLSGGERQRIAIARAFLKDSPLLILDEPTSALDSGTEMLIRKTLENLMQGRTTLLISHRLSLLSVCDRILVIEDHRIRDFAEDVPAALDFLKAEPMPLHSGMEKSPALWGGGVESSEPSAGIPGRA